MSDIVSIESADVIYADQTGDRLLDVHFKINLDEAEKNLDNDENRLADLMGHDIYRQIKVWRALKEIGMEW